MNVPCQFLNLETISPSVLAILNYIYFWFRIVPKLV